MRPGTVVLFAAVLSTSCGQRATKQSFTEVEDEFIYNSLAFSPVAATSAGYHQHQGVKLDAQLDDFSPAGLDRQRNFYKSLRYRLGDAVSGEQLSPEDRADSLIIRDQIELALLELNEIENFRHNPTVYVELIGNALFNPLVLEYAPKPERLRDIIARTRKIPAFLEQARKNLTSSPEIWTKVAIEENQGNLDLLERVIPAAVPPDMRLDYDGSAKPAIEALHHFQSFLQDELGKRKQAEWRLSRDLYGRKFRFALETESGPIQVLRAAEAELKTVRARMLELSLPLHQKMYPSHSNHSDLPAHDHENRVISEVLDRIAEHHARPDTYMADAKRDLEEARAFVRAKNLLTLPGRENLQIIETPEFMRGIYAVGGFAPAPVLEPRLGAFYWVTPIPASWPKARIESKLREYNFYHLKLLTIHEAMPGHYVQFEFASGIEPKRQCILRSIWGNGPYIEGWATYAEQMMLDEGFLNNSPELRLTLLKEELRVLANAILDVRLHMFGMTDQQALDLMEKETFQETEEATAKLQRAKLSSCQLPTYFVGWRDWLSIREGYQKLQGVKYSLRDFHDRALKEGAVPLPALARLLNGEPQGETRSK